MELTKKFNIARYLSWHKDAYEWLIAAIEGRRMLPLDELGPLRPTVKDALDVTLLEFWNDPDTYMYERYMGFTPKFLHQKYPEVLVRRQLV